MLAYLRESSGRTAKDLLPVFGTRGRVSEALNGKRSISKGQAKKLAAMFKVTADLFIRWGWRPTQGLAPASQPCPAFFLSRRLRSRGDHSVDSGLLDRPAGRRGGFSTARFWACRD